MSDEMVVPRQLLDDLLEAVRLSQACSRADDSPYHAHLWARMVALRTATQRRQPMSNGMTPRPLRQRLMTPCWCQWYADLVDTDDITQGRTWSCGRADCKPPEETT